MKQLTLLLLTVTMFSCNKTNSPENDNNNSIIGTWTETENYISPGAPTIWKPANNITLTINSDFTYSSTNDAYLWGRKGKIEELTDSTFVINSSLISSPFKCSYSIKNGVLEVWYPCTEGCGSRFRKATTL